MSTVSTPSDPEGELQHGVGSHVADAVIEARGSQAVRPLQGAGGPVGNSELSPLADGHSASSAAGLATGPAGTDILQQLRILGHDTNRVPKHSLVGTDVKRRGKTSARDQRNASAVGQCIHDPQIHMQTTTPKQVLQMRLMNRRNQQCYLNALVTCLHGLSLAAHGQIGTLGVALHTLSQQEELDILQSERRAPASEDGGGQLSNTTSLSYCITRSGDAR